MNVLSTYPLLKSSRFLLFLIFVLTVLVYANALTHGFAGDDRGTIVNCSLIKSWENFPAIFTQSYITPMESKNGSGELTYRPVVTISYFADYAVWKLNPFGYHLTNLFLHLLNILALFILSSLLLKNKGAALLCALFFAVHPANSEPVCALSYREDLLAFFFFITSFIFFIKKDEPGCQHVRLFIFFSLLLYSLALFSKEMAITLPLVLIFYDYFFVLGLQWRKVWQRARSRYFGYFAVTGVYLGVWGFFNDSGNRFTYLGGNFYTNILTMSKVIPIYLSWLFWPANIHITFPESKYAPNFISHSIFQPQTFFSFALIVLCLWAAWKMRKKAGELSFSIVWFFITLLPVLNIVPISCNFASRYLYLPIAGFLLGLSFALMQLEQHGNRLISNEFLKKSGRTIMVTMVIMFSLITGMKNLIWKDNLTTWFEGVKCYPAFPRQRMNLADEFAQRNLMGDAIREYKATIRFHPAWANAYNALGVIYQRMGSYGLAMEQFQKAISINSAYRDAYYNLGFLYSKMEKWNEAEETVQAILKIDPGSAVGYLKLGMILSDKGDYERSIESFNKALSIDPRNVDVLNNLARARANMQKRSHAKDLQRPGGLS